MDIINTYVDFKTKSFLELIDLMTDSYIDEYFSHVLNEYIDTFVQTYYFHSLQTLNDEDVKKYGISTIIKEFDGKRLEILFETVDRSRDKELIVDKAYNLVLACVRLELCEMNIEEYKEILSGIRLNCDVEDVFEYLSVTKEKEARFLSELTFDYFELDYHNYRGKEDKYLVELESHIKQLEVNYSKNSIDKNFNKDDLAYEKLRTLMAMLSSDLLKKVINSEVIDYYFVPVSSVLLDDDRLKNIFNMMTNPYIREHIVFVINYNDYVNHKRILNYFDVDYSLAANVDMSHINDIENKIENVENIKMFDYILLDKVKQKDYEAVLKYDTLTGKEIFMNELERM